MSNELGSNELGSNELGASPSVNWITAGAVNPIKNQGSCGSCYSFGSTAVVEAAIFNAGWDLPNLSEQQIVSCSQKYGNNGCNGGYQPYVFTYLQSNYQTTYADYPYVSGDNTLPACNTNVANGGNVMVTTHGAVTQQSQSAMMTAISQNVVTVAVDASTVYFQQYTSGILDTTACGTNLDHAIAAVGYGTSSDGTPYYLVRNSWSTQWGEEGYVRIAMVGDGPGICGIQLAAFTA